MSAPFQPLGVLKVATPPAPAAGELLLYAKSDDKLYVQSSSGVETPLGSGGGSASRTFAFFMS